MWWGLAALMGLLVGSLLTVVVVRVPEGRSICRGRSSCDACGHVLGIVELVPLVSWMMQRGRCRRCEASIGVVVPFLELSSAVLCAASLERFGRGADGFAMAVTGCALLAQAVIDVRTHRLPREISWTALLLVAVLLAVTAAHRHTAGRLFGVGAGALIFTVVLAAVRRASRGGMGDGDVRLAPLLGAVLGWWGIELVPVALVVASASGALAGLVLIVCGRADRRSAIPFGPFLALGTITTLWCAAGG